ncbi:MAG: choice-of-anchor R domain-containing protein [Terriglobales bacterium]
MKETLFTCLLLFCNLTLFAQAGQSPRMVHVNEVSAIHTPPEEAPAGLTKIYSNFGSSKTDLYNDLSGWDVWGPHSSSGGPFFVGIPFTPKSNSHVSRVQVAVQYVGGANQVNLSIYGDTNGGPGTLLAGPVTITNLPNAGTCCHLAVANFSPLAVTAGTRYWVVADTPLTGTGSDFSGIWNIVVKTILMGADGGAGWQPTNADVLAAGEVLGTIP